MLKPLRVLGSSILCVQLLLSSVFAQEREPAGFIPTVQSREVKPVQLTHEAAVEVRNLLYDNISAKMRWARNLVGFQSLYLRDLSKQDQYEFLVLMSKIDELPKFRRIDDRLIASIGNEKLTLRWPNPLKSEVFINGVRVSLRIDKPLFEQTVAVVERLRYQKVSGVLDLALPKAEAVTATYGSGPYKIVWNAAETATETAARVGRFGRLIAAAKSLKGAAIVGTLIVGIQSEFVKTMTTTVTTGVTDTFCLINESVNHVAWLSFLCADWDKERREKAWAAFPKLDSLITIENASANGRQIESEELACPTKNDKKDRVLLAKIRPVEWKDGVKVPLREEYSILRAVFDSNANPKSLMVGPIGLDMEKALETDDGKNRIWLNIGFAKEKGEVRSIEINNPAYAEAKSQHKQEISSDQGILSSATQKVLGDLPPPTLEINPMMKLTPLQSERLKNAQRIVEWAKAKTFACVVNRSLVQIEKGINPVQAADPGVDTPGSANVQPAKAVK